MATLDNLAEDMISQKFRWPVKRALDVVISLLFLLLSPPLFLICAALIKLTSKGHVFFRWNSIGKNARRITSLKFRSMTEDAEEQGCRGVWEQGSGKRGAESVERESVERRR